MVVKPTTSEQFNVEVYGSSAPITEILPPPVPKPTLSTQQPVTPEEPTDEENALDEQQQEVIQRVADKLYGGDYDKAVQEAQRFLENPTANEWALLSPEDLSAITSAAVAYRGVGRADMTPEEQVAWAKATVTGGSTTVQGVDEQGKPIDVAVGTVAYREATQIENPDVKLQRLIELGVYPAGTTVISDVAAFNKEFGTNISPDMPYATPNLEGLVNLKVRGYVDEQGALSNQAFVKAKEDNVIKESLINLFGDTDYLKQNIRAIIDAGAVNQDGTVNYEAANKAGIQNVEAIFQALQPARIIKGRDLQKVLSLYPDEVVQEYKDRYGEFWKTAITTYGTGEQIVTADQYQDAVNFFREFGGKIPTGFESYNVITGNATTKDGDVISGDNVIEQVREIVKKRENELNEKLAQLNIIVATSETGERTIDVNAVINALDNGDITKDELKTIIPSETLKEIEEFNRNAKQVEQQYRSEIGVFAYNNSIEISDASNLNETQIQELLSKGIDAAVLVAAGNDIGKVNTQVAILQNEYDTYVDRYNRVLPYGTTGSYDMAAAMRSGEKLIPATFSITQLAAWQRDNPNDISTLNILYKDNPTVVDEVREYNRNLYNINKDIDTYFSETGSIDFIDAYGRALNRAMSEIGIDVVEPREYIYSTEGLVNPETGNATTPRELIKYQWDKLTDEQKEKAALALASDPTKGNEFTSMNRDLENIAQKGGIVTQLALAPVLNTTSVLAKQITLDEMRDIMKQSYKPLLDATTEWAKDDGTIDVEKMKDYIGFQDIYGEKRKELLDKTGYEDFETLVENAEYYNNSVKVSAAEWALAGGNALALGLGFGGSGALAATGNVGKWLARGLWTAGGVAFIPSSINTIASPKAALWEKVLAGAAPVLMILGATGVKTPTKTTATATTVASEVATKRVPVTQVIANSLEKTGYRIAKFVADERGGAAMTDIKLPDVIKVARDAAGNIKYTVIGIGSDIAKLSQQAVQSAINTAVHAKVYAKYGIKADVINAIDNVANKAKIAKAFSEYVVKDVGSYIAKTGKQIGTITTEMVQDAVMKALQAKAYLKYGLSEDIGNLLSTSKEYIKYISGIIKDNVVDLYNKAQSGAESTIQNVAWKAIQTKVYLKYGLSPDIGNAISSSKNFARFIGNEIKVDAIKLRDMTVEQATNFISDAIFNALKAKAYLKYGIREDVAREIANSKDFVNYLAGVIRDGTVEFGKTVADKFNNSLNDTVFAILKSKSYVKYGLASDIKNIYNRYSSIARYIYKQTMNGINKGIVDAYSAANIRKALAEIEQAIKTKDVELLKKAASDIDEIGNTLPDEQGKVLSDSATSILNNADDIIKNADTATVKDIQSWLDNLKRLEEQRLPELYQDIDTYLQASKRTAGETAEYLDKLYKQNAIDDIETYLRARGKTPKEIAEYLDELAKGNTVDDIETFLRAQERKNIPSEIDDLLDDIDDYLKDKGDDILPEDTPLDNIVKERGGTKTAVKEKTKTVEETKTKTAEELEKELFTEETKPETKPVVAPETTPKTITKTTTTTETPVIPIVETETELGVIVYPFNPDLYPDEAKEYERMIRETRLTKGYVEESERVYSKELEDRINELTKTMTYEQALKRALEEFKSGELPTIETITMPVTTTKTIESEQPQPELEPSIVQEPTPTESVATETVTTTATETMTEPLVEPMPQPEPLPEPEPIPEPVKPVEEETTIPKAPPIIKSEIPDAWKKTGIPPGTVEWRQGVKWAVLPPPYRDEDMIYLDNPLPGTKKFAVGKGSARKTLQILGGAPPQDADVDMGWAQIHISSKDGKIDIQFGGGEEAANDRWAMEESKMSELERESYSGIPIGLRETSKIPRIRNQRTTLENVKEIYPPVIDENGNVALEDVQKYIESQQEKNNNIVPNGNNLTYVPAYYRRKSNAEPIIEESSIQIPSRYYLGRKLRKNSLGLNI